MTTVTIPSFVFLLNVAVASGISSPVTKISLKQKKTKTSYSILKTQIDK